ncbi:AraC family transcriptional regulator [Paenibacillus sp. J5C_2022]|uniref:AraC family transcriptional regulator n=1 Tax=Paenibacillus sp. J5C2022 TaxID=2977129 RepID=UPI0021D28F8E|nr:AraC family transcriptional regulator [Paenibacillus sp. J5C2022]MCU6708419.1 AraC family transcriptional regulator [Paenibacillus sp. J5C2022]
MQSKGIRELNLDRKILLIYMTISLAVVAASFFMYNAVSRIHSAKQQMETFQNINEALASSIRIIDNKVNSVYTQISVDPLISSWISAPIGSETDYYVLGEIQKKFLGIQQFYPEIASFYLYNSVEDKVLATNYMISSKAEFPNGSVLQQFQESGEKTILYYREHEKEADTPAVLSYVTNVPAYSDKGILVINLKVASLLSVFPDQGQGIVLLDTDNRVLAHSDAASFQTFLSRKDLILESLIHKQSFRTDSHFYYASDKPSAIGLKIIFILPESKVHQRPSVGYIAAILLICACMIYYSFRLIKRGYSKPLDYYRSNLSTNMDELRHVAVSSLLSGKQSYSLLKPKLVELGLELNAPHYAVVVLQIDDFFKHLLSTSQQDRFYTNKLIFNTVKWMFMIDQGISVVQSEFEKIGILIPVESGDDWNEQMIQVERTIQYIQKEVKDNFQLTVCAALSDSCDGIEQVHLAYDQCLRTLQYKTIYGKEAIIHYRNLPSGGVSLNQYPLESVNRMSEQLKTGDLQGLSEELERTFSLIIAADSFSPDLIHAVSSNLMYAFVKVILEFRYEIGDIFHEDLFITLYSLEDLKDKEVYILNVCERIIAYRNKKEASTGNKTLRLIMDYIHQHFDTDLSLTMLADELKMNATYLSTLIKNELGIGFLDYVNDLRINKAVILLKETSLTVQEISEQCGYLTVHSFIRNFKKKHSHTPSEYRHVHASERM